MKTHIELPATFAEFCRVVHADLEACEVDPRYAISMHTWHEPYDDRCTVCAAGAIMAQRGDVSPDVSVVPGHFDAETARKLMAADDLRMGEVYEAYETYTDTLDTGITGIPEYPGAYRGDPVAFKAWLLDVAAWAEENRL